MFESVKAIDSAEGNVRKYVFSNNTAVAEAVLYRYPDYQTRTVICCSTMSGCPVGCRFCGAGDYFVRSLGADEVLEQVKRCLLDTGVDPNTMERLQIMFMSMGEPLLNRRAMEIVLHELYSLYPKAALLISTIGPDIDYEWVRNISIEVPTVGLQFSIHQPNDARRDKLIPFQAKLNLSEIATQGEAWHRATGRRPFFNYCAGDDNTSKADAESLYATFDPIVWNATVSVICERNEGMPAKNDHQMKLAQDFASNLVGLGFDVRVFDPAGQDDIGGGCGQLWFVQDWMRSNSDKAKPSIGHGLPSVHTPA
jgi:23S rRNA (adenine2503-C2)-methyltransferase